MTGFRSIVDDAGHEPFDEQGGADADDSSSGKLPPPHISRDCREPVTATCLGVGLAEALSPRLRALGLCDEQVGFLCAWARGGFSDPAVLASDLGLSEAAVAWRFRRIRQRKQLRLDNSAQLAALLTHFVHQAGCAGAIFSTGRFPGGHNEEGVR